MRYANRNALDAIFSEDELPEDQAVFLELNAELAEVWQTSVK